MVQKVVFLIPSYSVQPCMEFQISALETNDLLMRSGIQPSWRYAPGNPYVHKSRNKLVSEFLKDHDCGPDDRAFFLDDDIGWEGEAVLRMVQRPEDIIAGIYPKKNDAFEEWPAEMMWDDDTKMPIVEGGLCLASKVPTGFLCIKKHVLERCAEQSGIYSEEDPAKGSIRCWDIFRTGFVPFEEGGNEGCWWGEDFFWSVMVRQLGFECWIDPDIRFTHRGTKAWQGRFRNAIEAKIAEFHPRNMIEDVPAIKRWGEWSPLAGKVSVAFNQALNGNTYLPEDILTMEGMSGRRYRIFINNLMREIESPRYLEIGSFTGSTVIAACHNTAEHYTCIDNWSLMGGPRDKFLANIKQVGIKGLELVDGNFENVDFSTLRKHNVFMYDGSHKEHSQRMAIIMAAEALDDEYVLIVDDWNLEPARSGTFAGLRESGQRIVSAIEIRPSDLHSGIAGQRTDWHNGYLIAVVRKNESMATLPSEQAMANAEAAA